jgi:hypothetical protein
MSKSPDVPFPWICALALAHRSATVTSLVLFVINAALLRYALHFDRNRAR